MPSVYGIAVATLAATLIGNTLGLQTKPTFWPALKRQLAGANGEEYFESTLKGAMLPRLKGTLITALVRDGLSRLTVSLTDSEAPEVAIIFHTRARRVKGDPKKGTPIEFAGVVTGFTKEPFLLTPEVEAGDLSGLELEPSKANPKAPPERK